MKRLAFTYLLILIATSGVVAQYRTPRFADFRVSTKFSGRNAKPILDKDAKVFRTRIGIAAKQKPNFAGEFIVGSWGCGSECLSGVVINARTGRVYQIPFTVCCWSYEDASEPVDFRNNSRLIVFSGTRDERPTNTRDDLHYYEFKNGRFRYLKTLKRPN
jgi:hypothetical protein